MKQQLYVARADAKTNQILRRVRRVSTSKHIECVVVGRVDGKKRGIGSTTYLKPESLERGYDLVEFVPLKILLEVYRVNVARQLPEALAQQVAEHGISLKIDGKGGHYVPARLLEIPAVPSSKPESALDTREFENGLDEVREKVKGGVDSTPDWVQRLRSEMNELTQKIDAIALALDITTKPTVNGVDTTDSLFGTTDEFLSARG